MWERYCAFTRHDIMYFERQLDDSILFCSMLLVSLMTSEQFLSILSIFSAGLSELANSFNNNWMVKECNSIFKDRDGTIKRGVTISVSFLSGEPGLMDRVLALHAGSRGFNSHRGHMSERFFRSNRPGYPHPLSSELEISDIRVAVGDCRVTGRRR